MSAKTKKPLLKRWYVWGIGLIVIGGFAAAGGNGTPQQPAAPASAPAVAPKAPANDPGISMAEFGKIENGMTYEQVVQIVGGPGELISETGAKGDAIYTVMYSWKGEKGLGANANLMLQGNKVQSKAQAGLK